MHTYIHTHVHTHIHIHIHKYTHAYNIHIYAYMKGAQTKSFTSFRGFWAIREGDKLIL